MTEPAATEGQKPQQTFPPSYSHAQHLEDLSGIHYMPHFRVIDYFREHGSYELREAAINQFNSSEQTIYASEQADWEAMILFLKEQEYRRADRNLYPKVLTAYLFKADNSLIWRALRFAIKLLEEKYRALMIGNPELIKIIFGRLKKGLGVNSHEHDPELREIYRQYRLNGLFAVLPEIIPVLGSMLDTIYNPIDIANEKYTPEIDYGWNGFVQVERALRLILKEKEYNLDFLPTIEKMALAHKEKLKRSRIASTDETDEDKYDSNLDADPFFYV
ncbi:MAG: hypothetical protein WC517_05110, partial [Patescibacteria group bacterium]